MLALPPSQPHRLYLGEPPPGIQGDEPVMFERSENSDASWDPLTGRQADFRGCGATWMVGFDLSGSERPGLGPRLHGTESGDTVAGRG